MLTYQDYENAQDKSAFVLQAVAEYQSSELYQNAKTAISYYNQENEYILKRQSAMEKVLPPGIDFHKLPSSFYSQFVLEWVFYALGNGLTLDQEKKERLGDDFDMRLLLSGVVPACHSGVSYGFWNFDHVIFYGSTEGFPLLDERTSNIKLFIHFWQIDEKKPLRIEVFDENGITEYVKGDNGLEEVGKSAYKTKVKEYGTGQTEVVDTETYSEIPVYPLYVNEKKLSEFTKSLKRYIDAFDSINSDGVNSILQNEGVHWIFNNYGGEDLKGLIDILVTKFYKTETEDVNTSVANFTVESPYQGKQAVLESLERRMYAGFMLPNNLQDGRAVTATEMKYANENKNIKADILEWCACQFIGNLLRIQGIKYKQSELSFKRRSVIDDTEVVNNLSTQLADGYIDRQKALEDAPNITDDEVDEILARLDLIDKEQADNDFSFEEQREEETAAGDE